MFLSPRIKPLKSLGILRREPTTRAVRTATPSGEFSHSVRKPTTAGSIVMIRRVVAGPDILPRLHGKSGRPFNQGQQQGLDQPRESVFTHQLTPRFHCVPWMLALCFENIHRFGGSDGLMPPACPRGRIAFLSPRPRACRDHSFRVYLNFSDPPSGGDGTRSRPEPPAAGTTSRT